MQLADIIKHNGRLISHAVKRLVEDYESKKNSVTFQILTMIFEVLALVIIIFIFLGLPSPAALVDKPLLWQACGAKHEIYPDYLRESDVDDVVVSLVDLAKKVSFCDSFSKESSSVIL